MIGHLHANIRQNEVNGQLNKFHEEHYNCTIPDKKNPIEIYKKRLNSYKILSLFIKTIVGIFEVRYKLDAIVLNRFL